MANEVLRANIEMLRARLGETQDQFADRFNVAQGTVSRWGASIPRGDQIIMLATLAGVLPSDFLNKPLPEAPRGAYLTLPVLERAIFDALPRLPRDAAKKAEFLAQAVLDAALLPEGLLGRPANDLDDDDSPLGVPAH